MQNDPGLNDARSLRASVELLPNLGAEEGSDWAALHSQPLVRAAARLWSLLFSGDSHFRFPESANGTAWNQEICGNLWPEALGPIPTEPIFDWLSADGGATAWLNTLSVERDAVAISDSGLSGPRPDCVFGVHDKAFSIKAARELGLLTHDLDATIRILEPDDLRSPDRLVEALDVALHSWPDWTRRAFTLKPRFGSSGRGRVAGIETLDHESIRGAFARLAKRGGALFEPWLARQSDLSVSLRVPPPDRPHEPTTILGTLEMLVTGSGAYRGHFGEVDSRGRVFSGHRYDETLRADAASVANLARSRNFYGPCGVDAFTYLEAGRERLRSLVEFNGRMTMGGVTIGLVRRALPQVRKRLELTPGDRRGLALVFADAENQRTFEQLARPSNADLFVMDLSSPGFGSDAKPLLIFAREPDRLRASVQQVFRC